MTKKAKLTGKIRKSKKLANLLKMEPRLNAGLRQMATTKWNRHEARRNKTPGTFGAASEVRHIDPSEYKGGK